MSDRRGVDEQWMNFDQTDLSPPWKDLATQHVPSLRRMRVQRDIAAAQVQTEEQQSFGWTSTERLFMLDFSTHNPTRSPQAQVKSRKFGSALTDAIRRLTSVRGLREGGTSWLPIIGSSGR